MIIEGWSFHTTVDEAERAYANRYDACARIFRRCGLTVQAVAAGAQAHAFFVPAPAGDARVLRCDGCAQAALAEHAALAGGAGAAVVATEPLTELHTPGKGSLADVVAFLGGGLDAARFVKTLVYTADGAPLVALVRGDREVNEAKLQAAVGAATLALAPPAVVREVTGAEIGFAGAQGLTVPVWADFEVAALPSALTGANRTDYHVRGFHLAREAPNARLVDLRQAAAGDACGGCQTGHYREERGLVVGRVGRSVAPCHFRDADGSDKPMGMTRYDLAAEQIAAAVVAQHHDADGTRWPMTLAPFQVLIVTAGAEPELAAAAAALESELTQRGIEVLYDDRDERAGAKFKDADLGGIPLRVTVGKRGLTEGKLELKVRGDKETTMVPNDEIAAELSHRVQEALSMSGRERLIVALDHPDARAALAQVDDLGDAVERYKVGLELYIAEGRALIDALHERDKRVFLDLKLHDIPETVRRAAEVAAKMGVELLTVHACGGRKMLEAAVAGAGATKVLAVTVLTSLDAQDLVADGIADGVETAVLRRARVAEAARCAGVIASPHEAAAIRAAVAPGFLVVTPGVRLAETADDQKRVATPRAARSAGADAVVVGRPIRDAKDRRAAAAAFVGELS